MTRREADKILMSLLGAHETLETMIEDYPEVHSINRAHDRMLDVIEDVELFLNGMIYTEDQQ